VKGVLLSLHSLGSRSAMTRQIKEMVQQIFLSLLNLASVNA
jgi:hypothetical protein